MDIFSHGLWAGAAAKAANKKRENKIKVWQAVFWGMFPDLFAFTPAFLVLFWLLATGQMSWGEWPGRHGSEPAATNGNPSFALIGYLYSFSHSIIVFILIFGLAWVLLRKPVWEMLGWLLHILMDVPTHPYSFYPTPVFWPLFGWKFDGISWAQPWFLVLDYGLLIIVYWLLREKKTKSVE